MGFAVVTAPLYESPVGLTSYRPKVQRALLGIDIILSDFSAPTALPVSLSVRRPDSRNEPPIRRTLKNQFN